jgi:hypothetical protein
MRQTELHLSSKDRRVLGEVRTKGLRHVREVNRAHILAASDRRVPESQIMVVLKLIESGRRARIEDSLSELVTEVYCT